MSIDKVQLQQQEVINNEVVLTDINPITSTDSVFDPSSGSSMQEVIDRLWNAINSKLPRVVNSVNNRTGAVVLNPGDVGLGNVDDVSFNDIKNWVIEYFSLKMSKYRFKLYDTLAEMQTDASTNERSLDSVPFYVKSETDVSDPTGNKLAYIGYFYWDDNTSTIEVSIKEINVVGATDNSLNYDQGHLSVNIYPDEDNPLYLDNGEEDPTKTGLRVDTSKLASEMLSSPFMYTDVTRSKTGMLSTNGTGPNIKIYIDGTEIPPSQGDFHHLASSWVTKIKNYTQIMTEFQSDYSNWYDSGTPIPGNQNETLELMDRQPAIGVITKIPDPNIQDDYYQIEFHSIKTFTSGMGLKYIDNHAQTTVVGKQLAVDTSVDATLELGGLSGLAAKATGLLPKDSSSAGISTGDLQDLAYRPMKPYGDWRITPGIPTAYTGLTVASDDTICRYPAHLFNPSGKSYRDTNITSEYYGSKYVENWSPIAYCTFGVGEQYTGEQAPDGIANGYQTSTSYLSINMNKLVRDTNFKILHYEPTDWSYAQHIKYRHVTNVGDNDFVYTPITNPEPWEDYKFAERDPDQVHKFHFTNVSGLRTTHSRLNLDGTERNFTSPAELSESNLKELGIYDGKDSLGHDLVTYPFDSFSGGISVNTGNFLEICPKETYHGSNYDDSGKVNVRIGKGLCDDIDIDTDFQFPEYPNGFINGYINKDVFDTATCPPDWYTNPENYAVIDSDNVMTPVLYYDKTNILDTSIKYRLIVFEGSRYFRDNWDTDYYKYYVKFPVLNEYDHITDNQAPQPVEGTYYYYGPAIWNEVAVAIDTFMIKGIVRIKRKNRIAVNVDDHTIGINSSTNKLEIKSSITGVASSKHYYPGEIFTNTTRDTLYLVQDPNGVDVVVRNSSDNIDELVRDNKIAVFRQTSGGGAVIGIRRFATGTLYAKDEVIECELNKTTFLARVIDDFKPDGGDDPDDCIKNNQIKPITPIPNNTTMISSDNGNNVISTKVDGKSLLNSTDGVVVNYDNITIKYDDAAGVLNVPIDGRTIIVNNNGELEAVNSGSGSGAAGVTTDEVTINMSDNNQLSVKHGDTLWTHNGTGSLDVDFDSTMCVRNRELSVNYDDTLCVRDAGTTDAGKLGVKRSGLVDGETIKWDEDNYDKLYVPLGRTLEYSNNTVDVNYDRTTIHVSSGENKLSVNFLDGTMQIVPDEGHGCLVPIVSYDWTPGTQRVKGQLVWWEGSRDSLSVLFLVKEDHPSGGSPQADQAHLINLVQW